MTKSVNLVTNQSTAVAGKIQTVEMAPLYTVEVITDGTVTSLTVEIFGSISKSNMQSLVSHDVIASGKLFHISGKAVNAMQGEILSIVGGGKASIVVQAVA